MYSSRSIHYRPIQSGLTVPLTEKDGKKELRNKWEEWRVYGEAR
jgi:hypothetical protein